MKKQHKKHQNRHHLRPKSRGGQSIESNIIWIDIERHKSWHSVFGNLTLDEIISLLIRLREIKKRQEQKIKL